MVFVSSGRGSKESQYIDIPGSSPSLPEITKIVAKFWHNFFLRIPMILRIEGSHFFKILAKFWHNFFSLENYNTFENSNVLVSKLLPNSGNSLLSISILFRIHFYMLDLCSLPMHCNASCFIIFDNR